jgi:hypothetical protein
VSLDQRAGLQAVRLQSLVWRQIYRLIRDDDLAIMMRIDGDYAIAPHSTPVYAMRMATSSSVGIPGWQ